MLGTTATTVTADQTIAVDNDVQRAGGPLRAVQHTEERQRDDRRKAHFQAGVAEAGLCGHLPAKFLDAPRRAEQVGYSGHGLSVLSC
jgi:hypothetical protein